MKRGISGVKMLPVLLVSTMLTWVSVLFGQPTVRPLLNVTVTITPAKTTLFAGETETFVATVVGIEDTTVRWAVDEENGGTITELGKYTAPKIQGVYHITATSRGRPQTKGVATVTVLAYCDPLPPAFNR
jgi:hypothetical protein